MRLKKGNSDRDRRLRNKYNISEVNYNAMFAEQNGVCFICCEPETAREFLAVDHCHKTGKVRGLLCADCNRALGQFQDNVNILKRAVQYLERTYVAPEPEPPEGYIPHEDRKLWRVLITTPDGVFASEQDASRFYKMDAASIRYRTKSNSFPDWSRGDKVQLTKDELLSEGIIIVDKE